jgi:hypothetical protein
MHNGSENSTGAAPLTPNRVLSPEVEGKLTAVLAKYKESNILLKGQTNAIADLELKELLFTYFYDQYGHPLVCPHCCQFLFNGLSSGNTFPFLKEVEPIPFHPHWFPGQFLSLYCPVSSPWSFPFFNRPQHMDCHDLVSALCHDLDNCGNTVQTAHVEPVDSSISNLSVLHTAPPPQSELFQEKATKHHTGAVKKGYYFPLTINGHSCIAIYDSGADCSLISLAMMQRVNWTITPAQGLV